MVLNVQNANNHQCTWAVLREALWAVGNFMAVRDMWGEAEFSIFDGQNQVGQGSIGV